MLKKKLLKDVKKKIAEGSLAQDLTFNAERTAHLGTNLRVMQERAG